MNVARSRYPLAGEAVLTDGPINRPFLGMEPISNYSHPSRSFKVNVFLSFERSSDEPMSEPIDPRWAERTALAVLAAGAASAELRPAAVSRVLCSAALQD